MKFKPCIRPAVEFLEPRMLFSGVGEASELAQLASCLEADDPSTSAETVCVADSLSSVGQKDDYDDAISAAVTRGFRRHDTAKIRGRINYIGDSDVLGVVASKSGTMTTQLQTRGRRRRGGDLSCELTVYDSNGEQIATQIGQAFQLDVDVSAGEVYYIEITGSGQGVGKYRITARIQHRVDPPPDPDPDPPAPDPDPDPVDPPDPDPPAPTTDPVPGQSVLGEVISDGGLSILRVCGTDAGDTITLSQSGQSITLSAGASTQTFTGAFDGLWVYGFAGSDTIRLANSTLVVTKVFAGDGDDSVFDAGQGDGLIYGGEGNDRIVCIGGGSDTLRGEAGLDSLWFDASDVLADASAAENAAGAVHEIAEFYQPYTSNPGSSSYVSLEIAGQDLGDPSASGSYVNFADRALFTDGPELDDIDQGSVGDCYFLAAIGSLAQTDPDIIEQMVTPLGDGTYAVRFYRYGVASYVRVDADLPVSYGESLVYAKFTPDGEMWVPLLEKAYAYFRKGENSYSSLSMGWMSDVYKEATNVTAGFLWTGSSTAASLYQYLDSALSAGHATSLGSYSSAAAPIVGSHAYVVQSVQTVNEQMYVTVYNPWGVDGRSWDSNYYDGLLTISIDQVIQCFSAVSVSMA